MGYLISRVRESGLYQRVQCRLRQEPEPYRGNIKGAKYGKVDHKRHKHKIDRRLGVNLWVAQNLLQFTRIWPRQHGQRRKKPTDFGVQLMAKQKLKGYGNIGEKQFKKYYAKAASGKGDTGQNLIGILETRLDAVLYRAKIVPTVFAARQIINHGHVMLNGMLQHRVCAAQARRSDCPQGKGKKHPSGA